MHQAGPARPRAPRQSATHSAQTGRQRPASGTWCTARSTLAPVCSPESSPCKPRDGPGLHLRRQVAVGGRQQQGGLRRR